MKKGLTNSMTRSVLGSEWLKDNLLNITSQVVQAILRHVNFDVVKAILIASPGFVRQQFFDYMYQQVRLLVIYQKYLFYTGSENR